MIIIRDMSNEARPRNEGGKTYGADDDERRPVHADGVRSEALLGADGRLKILHNKETYTLRITSNNKLILTK
jgi:hemin uptake protein HemP